MQLPEIRLLQAAVVLSEVRNYTRAAKKLGIQQPTLTKRILELEKFVGFELFDRTTQFVEPTEACRRLVHEAKEVLFHAGRALQVAIAAQQGAQTLLHVGKSQYTDPYLVSMTNSVSLPLYPNLQLLQTTMFSTDLEEQVLLGKLDMAIVNGGSDNPKITHLELFSSPFFIALPANSPLARGFEITLRDLDQRHWALFERHVHPVLHDSILRFAAADGITAQSITNVMTAEDAAQLLYSGTVDAAFLTRAGAWKIARNGLTMRPLKDDRLVLSYRLIARANNESQLVSEFTRALKRKPEGSRGVQLNLPLERKQVTRATSISGNFRSGNDLKVKRFR
jgi:DNA-binding transcriptional LysR family regulator